MSGAFESVTSANKHLEDGGHVAVHEDLRSRGYYYVILNVDSKKPMPAIVSAFYFQGPYNKKPRMRQAHVSCALLTDAQIDQLHAFRA